MSSYRPRTTKLFHNGTTHTIIVVVVIVLLFYVHGKQLWVCRDGQLT